MHSDNAYSLLIVGGMAEANCKMTLGQLFTPLYISLQEVQFQVSE